MPVHLNTYSMQFQAASALIDTHCHLDCEPICSRLDELLADAFKAGVKSFIVPGVHPDNWERIALLAERYHCVNAAFGIHPMHAGMAAEAVLERLGHLAPKGVAIGEIGLDPCYPVSPEIQENAFRQQLRIAIKLGLPVLIHCRRSFQKLLQMLKEENAHRIGGIMHAFSGSFEMAKEFIRLGFAISISGSVTWNNSIRSRELAAKLPLESIVIETDSPDMTPQRHKGQPNQPAWLPDILNSVAEVRSGKPDEIAAAICRNTQRVLSRLKPFDGFYL